MPELITAADWQAECERLTRKAERAYGHVYRLQGQLTTLQVRGFEQQYRLTLITLRDAQALWERLLRELDLAIHNRDLAIHDEELAELRLPPLSGPYPDGSPF